MSYQILKYIHIGYSNFGCVDVQINTYIWGNGQLVKYRSIFRSYGQFERTFIKALVNAAKKHPGYEKTDPHEDGYMIIVRYERSSYCLSNSPKLNSSSTGLPNE